LGLALGSLLISCRDGMEGKGAGEGQP